MRTLSRFLEWIWNYTPAILWTGVILLLIGLPGYLFGQVPSQFRIEGLDKVIHTFIFMVFVVFTMTGTYKQYKKGWYSVYTIAIILLGLFISGGTEILQRYVFIQRTASLGDFAADALGCALGLILFVTGSKVFFRLGK